MKPSVSEKSGCIRWQTDECMSVGSFSVPCASGLSGGYNQGFGIKRVSDHRRRIKQLIWPFWNAYQYLLVDGFIERAMGRLIEKYLTADAVMLEVGCVI